MTLLLQITYCHSERRTVVRSRGILTAFKLSRSFANASDDTDSAQSDNAFVLADSLLSFRAQDGSPEVRVIGSLYAIKILRFAQDDKGLLRMTPNLHKVTLTSFLPTAYCHSERRAFSPEARNLDCHYVTKNLR